MAETNESIVQTITSYRETAKRAKERRMKQNQENMDCYHLRQDFSHKTKGQSTEFLAKQSVATEQFCMFLQQGLIEQREWFRIEREPGVPEDLPIRPVDMARLTDRQLTKADFYTFMGDALKVGALQSLMIAKVHGRYVDRAIQYKAKYKLEMKGGIPRLRKSVEKTSKRVWELRVDLIRPENYYPDPFGGNLYECHNIEMDLHELIAMAEAEPDVYDLEVIQQLATSFDAEDRQKKSAETNEEVPQDGIRKRVRVTECWGTLIDPATGKVIMTNAVAAIANEKFLIRKPQKNPYWHEESPFVVSPILRVPFSVWHKALMDAPTKLNLSLNELFNLMLDAGIMSVFGIKQVRTGWLEDPSQVADGVVPGDTLKISEGVPVGGKVLERVDTGALSSEAFNMYSLADREFVSSAMSNETRMGMLPERAVKATEIVSTNQVLTGMMTGIVKNIEEGFVSKVLQKSWLTSAQHVNDMDGADVASLIGQKRATQLASMGPEEIFSLTALGHKFKAFGLSTTVNKINDFRKLTALLQTIGSAPALLEAFTKRYSLDRFLGEVIRGLDIDEDKITREDQMQDGDKPQPQAEYPMERLMAAMQGGGQSAVDVQSQIPQASASTGPETGVSIPRPQMLAGNLNGQG